MAEKIKRKIMAVTLILALVIGLIPGIAVTAYADPSAVTEDGPDYEINGTGYDWAGSDQSIVLAGTNDSLTIYHAPSAEIKIEVQSEDDSIITINGSSVACENTRIIISNDITLTLDNVNITAPVHVPALQLKASVSGGTRTIDVAGTNTFTAMGEGAGIQSDGDQQVVIAGSGILNATGGGDVSGKDGGNGILVNGLTSGSLLTIEGDVTIHATGGNSLTHSGGNGIAVRAGDLLIKDGTVQAISGTSKGTNLLSCGILAAASDTNPAIGGRITIEGGQVTAQGGASDYKGAYGIYAYNLLSLKGGSLTADGGKSVENKGGTAVMTYKQNLEVSDGSIQASGGDSVKEDGGIAISNFYKDIIISGGSVIAEGGVSTERAGGDGFSVIGDGMLEITGGTVSATGGASTNNFGGYGIRVNEQKLVISGGTLTAAGGDSENSFAGTGICVEKDTIEINGGVVNASGGNSKVGKGGAAIYNQNKDILITDGSVTATGGQCTSGTGGRGLGVAGTGNLVLNGGSVIATGGNGGGSGAGGIGIEIAGTGNLMLNGGSAIATGGSGGGNGAHAVFANLGTITVDNGANLTALGGDGAKNPALSGNGTTYVGGVGLRAAGFDGATLYGNTVTIANNAGNVSIRGGQGTSAERASIMGKDVYVGTGNIGPIVMEGSSNPRSIKNIAGGEDVYLVEAKADPAAAITMSSVVRGSSGNYIYRATTKADGVANMWLPAGSQTVSALGYKDGAVSIAADAATRASITLLQKSNSNSLLNILSQTDDTPGTKTGADEANAIVWEINVENAIDSVSLAGITVSAGASKHLYSNAAFTTEISGSDGLNLTAGSVTTAYVKVTAEDGITAKYYAVSIARAASGNGSSSSGGNGGTSTKPITNEVVKVNGQKQDAGEAKTTLTDGKTITTITINDTKLDKILESKGSGAIVTLPAETSSNVVIGELNGQTVKNMEKKEAVLEIKTGSIAYTLPASQLNIDSISEQVGRQVELKDIKVRVTIAEPSAATVKILQDTANKETYQLVAKPVAFEITCTTGSKTVEVSAFNGYVGRTIAIPDGVDPSKITTGIVLNENGTFSHVPTEVTVINGKYYAKINSLSNSTYSVIYNKMEFNDAKTHWARKSIENMGSRLVVSGDGNGTYRPNSDMTRAEFAAIVGKALGLRTKEEKSSFSDVDVTAWYHGYTMTAAAYGIVTGYNSSTFAPNDKITREQAMTMIARAMKITGLKTNNDERDLDELLRGYKDAGTISGYAKSAIGECLKTGVVSGKADQILAPKDFITRAEVAVIVERLLQNSELIEKKAIR